MLKHTHNFLLIGLLNGIADMTPIAGLWLP